MDNKNNKQYFWEVKQFFNKPQLNEAKKPTTNGILDTVKGVLNSNFNVREPNSFAIREGIKNSSSQIKNMTSNLLDQYGSKRSAEMPSNVSQPKNITSNLFNINEANMPVRPKQSMEREIGLAAQRKDMAQGLNSQNLISSDDDSEEEIDQPVNSVNIPNPSKNPEHHIAGTHSRMKSAKAMKNLKRARINLKVGTTGKERKT
jgi:hypothetical protein